MTAVFADPISSISPFGPHPPAEVGMPAPRRPLRTIVALHGDLDFAAAPALREQLRDALRHSHPIVLLDLSDVASCDSAGLAVLIGTLRRAKALGISLRLTDPQPQVTELLHTTGLDRSLTIERSPATEEARILEFRGRKPR